MRKLALLLVALSVGACSGRDSPTEPERVVGAYVLQSVADTRLPVIFISMSQPPVSITSGVITFQPSTDCESLLRDEDDQGAAGVHASEDMASCRYEQLGSTIILDFETSDGILQAGVDGEITATLNGRILTIIGGAYTFVYHRQ